MKSINRIQYFLFAIILLGMFASFAQNEYSSYLLNYPFILIGILFLIEMLLTIKGFNKNQSSNIFSFFEYLGLGLFFCGAFFITMHWTGADPLVLTGVLILLILYLGYGIQMLSKFFNKKSESILLLSIMAVITSLSILSLTFKLQNWAGTGILIAASGILSFILLLLIVFNIKIKGENGKINLRDFLRKINSKLVLSYAFFSFWVIYFALISIGIAPRLYSLENPPALEKMYQEHNPKSELYWKNFQNFLDNRKGAINHQDNVTSKNRNDSLEIPIKKK